MTFPLLLYLRIGQPDGDTRRRDTHPEEGIGVKIVMQLEKREREPVWMKKGHSKAAAVKKPSSRLPPSCDGPPHHDRLKWGLIALVILDRE